MENWKTTTSVQGACPMSPSSPRQIFSRSGWFCGIGIFVALILFFIPSCWGQIPQEGDTTSTPTIGAGHDYIHAPMETVNPANGSVSIRIPVRIPSGRGLTFPFYFAYDSNGANYLTTVTAGGVTGLDWASSHGFFSQGGWSNSLPMLSVGSTSYKVQGTQPPNSTQTCGAFVNYVFQDQNGNRHDLDLSIFGYTGEYMAGDCSGAPLGPPQLSFFNSTVGGEDSILATTTAPGTGTFGQLILNPVIVTTGDGTIFDFSGVDVSDGPTTLMAGSITDRNGNVFRVHTTLGSPPTFSYTDTLSRTVLSDSGFGTSPETLTVAGLSSPYTLTWTALSAPTFPATITNQDTSPASSCPTPPHAGRSVISSIALPNGQKFSFGYDTVYGALNKITYPSGGYVRYVWGLNLQAEEAAFPSLKDGCEPRYDTPAITDRYVSYDGTHEVLHQHFAYSTSWTVLSPSGGPTKSTTVTTTDLVSNTSYQTVYSYISFIADMPPNVSDNLTQYVPVEKTITYFDTTGTLLKTVAKSWDDPRLLQSEETTLPNGQSSLTILCYSSGAEIAEEDDYDFGTGAASLPSCTNNPTGAVAGPLLRKTVATYASFGNHIVDRPCKVVVENGSSNAVAETDYLYDGGSTVCGTDGTPSTQSASTPSGTHDETNYGPTSTTPRGNATKVTRRCLSGCATDSSTTYTYDETGQVLSMTSPCGNGTCGDMPTGSSLTTNYSYTDSYSSCGGNAPPSGASNAYLTQVTYPKTNGVNHVVSHCYDYSSDLELSTTDENGQTTRYAYADSLDRLTETDYPDGGQTLVSYNDTPPNPSMTVTRKLSTSGPSVTNVTVINGMGLTTESELTSDPQGTDFTVTSYDGLGRVGTVTNPYRSTSDPTYGVTTYAYDALDRTTSVTHPDGSKIQTLYTDNATEVTDEGNGTKSLQRISQTDGLGRLISICEVTSATQLGTTPTPTACGQDITGTGFLTTYQYDSLGNLLSVSQGGLNARTFVYNSLSQLTSATNPESGTTTYTYDLNGNVATKTDARSIKTTYSYDGLNRLLSKTYSDGTLPVNYTFDVSNAGGQTETYPVGRLVAETTGPSVTTRSLFSYDQMGRVVNNWQCTPSNCGGTPYALTYGYDLAGDMKSYTNGAGVTFTQVFDAAAQLTQLTSNLSDANHPGTLLSSVEYNALGSTVSDSLGNGVTELRSYTNRGQLSSLAAAAGATLAKATASFGISGSEQSVMQNCPGGGGTNATAGTAGTGSGTNASSPPPPCTTVYDTGSVSITVGPSNNPFTATASYGQFDTATTIAGFLVKTFNTTPGSPVTATSSGGTITLTSVVAGPDGDYPFSGNSQTNDPTDFSNPSFFVLAGGTLGGGGSLTGGTTVYTLNMTSYAPNGDILAANDSANGNWTYTYDDFNRLATANATGKAYTYGYDRFGNRWNQELSGSCTAGTAVCLTFDSNNRINNGIEKYDAAGNMTTDGFHNYTYDAEHRIVCMDSGAAIYLYDAEGRRARKITGASSCSATTGSGVTDYLYDQAGRAITEMSGTGVWNRGEIYAGGSHLATYAGGGSGTTYFNHADWLGTERVRTAVSGTLCESITSLPFGDGEATTGSCGDPSTRHFTGKMRDSESNLDDFGARYYSSNLGRFMSPDPTILSATLSNPQTWNRYGYVLNNPMSSVDTNGKWTTGEHNAIIDDVFSNMSDQDRSILKAASAEVDEDQSPQGAPKHGMSPLPKPGEDPNAVKASAMEAAGNWIDDNLDKAVDAQLAFEDGATSDSNKQARETLNSPDALHFFGLALHTVTDESSPEHIGFQTWHGFGDGAFVGAGYYPSLNDARAALHAGEERISSISPFKTTVELREKARRDAYQLWLIYQARLRAARKNRAKKKHKQKD